MRHAIAAIVVLSALRPAFGVAPYDRAGWYADLSTLAHGVSGRVTIVDADTFRIDNFHYDGGGISVYAYLGAANTNPAFASGLQAGPQLLGTPFNGGSLVVDLPPGQTLDGYNAVSIWCVVALSSFGSGSFGPPAYPRAGYSTTLPLGLHATRGTATIADERTIRLDNFFYDGNAPAVYVSLGEDSSNASFLERKWIGPRLTRAYSNETLTVQLLPGDSLSGYGAICIWCDAITACFTRGAFPGAASDLDIDGDVDIADHAMLADCLLGPDSVPFSACTTADLNGDGFVDLRDHAEGDLCRSGDGQRPVAACFE